MPLTAQPQRIFDVPIKFIGAHPANQWPTDDGKPKIAIVNHRAQGSVPGMDSWFWNPIAQASANLGVPPAPISPNDGAHLYVPLVTKAPYANGVGYDQRANPPSDMRLLRDYMSTRALKWSQYFGWTSQNKWTISIEYAGSFGQPLTAYQIETGAKINAYVILNSPQNLVPKTAEDMMWSHHELDWINRRNCHGLTGWEWSTLKSKTQEIIDAHRDQQGDQTMTEAERQELRRLREDFSYWVMGSERQGVVFDRILALESAIPIIRDVLGEQGQRIQALENSIPRTQVPWFSPDQLDASVNFDRIIKVLKSLDAPRYTDSDRARSHSPGLVFEMDGPNFAAATPLDSIEARVETLIQELRDLFEDLGADQSRITSSSPNPYPDAHGDMPEEYQNL